jgi:RHS repeat-associated protein
VAQDGLGSVRGVVDNSVGVLESRNYDPIGNPFGTTGTSQTDYGFTGEQTDTNAQVYLRARYYNPALGVFTALDPFEGVQDDPMSLNGYSYAHDNPTNITDPNGENPFAILIPAIIAVVGVVLAYEILQRGFRGAACLLEPNGAACKTKTLLENAACSLEELLKPQFPNIPPVRHPAGPSVYPNPVSTPIGPSTFPFPVSTPIGPSIFPYPISTPIPWTDPFPGESPINTVPGSNVLYSNQKLPLPLEIEGYPDRHKGKPPHVVTGIYEFWDRTKNAYYVGSGDLLDRLNSHIRNNRAKSFDDVVWTEIKYGGHVRIIRIAEMVRILQLGGLEKLANDDKNPPIAKSLWPQIPEWIEKKAPSDWPSWLYLP